MSRRPRVWLGAWSWLAAVTVIAACVERGEPPAASSAASEPSVAQELAAASDASGCFNTATWVPSTPVSSTCACDPYNPCASTLLSEQCSAYTPVGPVMTDTRVDSVICPNLCFGTQVVTTTTQTHSAFCTISYQCSGSTLPCTSTGTKYIKKRKVTYGPMVCPVEC